MKSTRRCYGKTLTVALVQRSNGSHKLLQFLHNFFRNLFIVLEQVFEEGGRFVLADSFRYFFSDVDIVKLIEVKLV